MGVANYSNAFVAQYSGAERHDRTGLAVWQSVLFSLAAGLVLIILQSAIAPVFLHIGHPPAQALEEEAYFRVLATGVVFALLNSSLMCFWTGRNKTWTVVTVGFASIFLNVVGNWVLIFGADGTHHMSGGPLEGLGDTLNAIGAFAGAPAMGIVGAGLATIGTDALSVLAFLLLFLRKSNRREYGTLPKRIFDFSLMRRMLRFGFGNGVQMLMDVGSFAVFNILMSMYGITALGGNVGAASSIAVSVNGVAFVPMLGLGAAASILVGHGIGSRDVNFAVKAVRSSRILILTYMAFMCVLFEVHPEFLVSIFAPGESMNPATREMAVNFLRMAGLFVLADGFFILYGNAIRGAGDTRYCMIAMAVNGWCVFAIPCIVAYKLGAGYYTLWGILVFSVFSIAAILYLRYRTGKWKNMKVIEETGSQRRRPGSASVRLSSPIVSEDGILTVPGDPLDPPLSGEEED
jgi:Na+-driven multidrug efflux pump